MKINIKKIAMGLAATLVVPCYLCTAFSAKTYAAVTNQSAAVPMYQYPTVGTFWSDITGAGSSTVPFVVVDPASGPGVSVDSNYTTAISNNTTSGIRSIGYVDTNYQSRSFQAAYDDIDTWYQMYPGVTGIFLDRVQTGNAADLCYIAGLYNHIKNTHPNALVVLNPGTHIAPSYEPYGDIFLNAENTFAAYQSGWTTQYAGFEDNPAYQNRFWQIVHTTNSTDYATALALTRANNAGWVYITDDTLPNPYDVTPSYWNTEVSDINALPASTIPNRGKTTLPSGCQDLTASTSNSNTTSAQSVKTASAITVTNTSSLYNVEPTTKIAFSLPTGVSLSGSGTNWTCTGSDCSYGSTISASSAAAVLAAEFTTTCDYSSGSVQGTLTNFAGNANSFTVGLTRPADCVAATLANTGLPTGVIGSIAAVVTLLSATVYLARARVHYVHETARRRNRW